MSILPPSQGKRSILNNIKIDLNNNDALNHLDCRLEQTLSVARTEAEKRSAIANQQHVIDNLKEELELVTKRAEAQSNLAVTLREQVVLLQQEARTSRPDPAASHQKWQSKVDALEKDLMASRSQYEAAERR